MLISYGNVYCRGLFLFVLFALNDSRKPTKNGIKRGHYVWDVDSFVFTDRFVLSRIRELTFGEEYFVRKTRRQNNHRHNEKSNRSIVFHAISIYCPLCRWNQSSTNLKKTHTLGCFLSSFFSKIFFEEEKLGDCTCKYYNKTDIPFSIFFINHWTKLSD